MIALRVGLFAGLALLAAAWSPAAASVHQPASNRHSVYLGRPLPSTMVSHPWDEGVDPAIENRLFYATYGALQSHNVLKVYAFSAGGYESAGIRISGRVPHEDRDLTVDELSSETVTLIRTTFDTFPDIQQVDVWATIPIAQSQQASVENTVFSVSADRTTYERIEQLTGLTDLGFLSAFGRVWIAPQVMR